MKKLNKKKQFIKNEKYSSLYGLKNVVEKFLKKESKKDVRDD